MQEKKKSIEFFLNRIFYEIVVFFQMRWIFAPLVTFANKFYKKKNKQKKTTKHIDINSFFSSYDYIITLRGTELFIGIGMLPTGLYLARNIRSVVISILVIIIVSVLPIFTLDYEFIIKDNKFVKYYKQFEQDSRRTKTIWVLITILFLAALISIFVNNWIFWSKHNSLQT